jgi:hypothetical protein
MPLEPRQKMKLENRRDKADDKVAAHYDSLLTMGINPYIKVRPPRPPRPYLKIDHAEEFASIHRPTMEVWDEFAPLPYADRYRLMGMAGYERKEIDKARFMAGKVGKGPRHFVGVGDGPTHSQSQEVAA